MFEAKRLFAKWALVGLLLAGTIGGWTCFLYQPTESMRQWSSALTGTVQNNHHQADIALGKWLEAHREPTLIDDRSAYRVIAARGDARELVSTLSNLFKIEMRRARPTIKQIAVPDPDSATGERDAINHRWPAFYERGADDYRLVYDYLGWRVWRRRD